MSGHPPLGFDSFSIKEFISKWNNNEILINQEYQRSYIWKPKQRRDLIESIEKNFSIGVLVIWINKNEQYEILDGQQRIETIRRYYSNEFPNSKEKKFEELSITEQTDFEAYRIYYMELLSVLREEQITDIFTRLQEGTPLNVAEKVNALHGEFRKRFMDTFENQSFFKKIQNTRFRARLLAAQFLLLELESNFYKNYFPDMTYDVFKRTNEKYKSIPKKKKTNYNTYINFLETTLDKERKKISFRDWISIYLLVSYLHKKKFNKQINFNNNFRKFILDFINNLNLFSIYDKVPPADVDPELFTNYMNYKQQGRKATSADSIKNRFNFILSEYDQMFPPIEEGINGKLYDVRGKTQYDLLFDLENNLREVIQEKLNEITPDWWKKRIPNDVRDNAEYKKSKNERPWPWLDHKDLDLIYYLDFSDYGKIIIKRDNWSQTFKKVFDDKEYISSSLKQLEPIRIALGHSRKLTKKQNTRLTLLVPELIDYINKAK